MAKRKSKRRGKPQKCEIKNCSKKSYRSLPTEKVDGALSDETITSDQRRTHICKKHYREYKKATRRSRELEQMGWD